MDRVETVEKAFVADDGYDWLLKRLKSIQEWCCEENDNSVDVRLRWHAEDWHVHSGDSSYDQDHRGYWGASSVQGDSDSEDLKSIAHELVEQVLDDMAQCI